MVPRPSASARQPTMRGRSASPATSRYSPQCPPAGLAASNRHIHARASPRDQSRVTPSSARYPLTPERRHHTCYESASWPCPNWGHATNPRWVIKSQRGGAINTRNLRLDLAPPACRGGVIFLRRALRQWPRDGHRLPSLRDVHERECPHLLDVTRVTAVRFCVRATFDEYGALRERSHRCFARWFSASQFFSRHVLFDC